ncbi:MAG: peptidylprolyl isomerase [Rhodospirillales bacterium]|nr:peptidylprolyl isomerase [Rhodospirillales bacterium]
MSFLRARTAALAVLIALGAAPLPLQAADNDPVVAVVNGKQIRKSALVDLQQQLPQLRQVPLEMVYEQLLDHLINSEIVTAEARKQKLQDDPKVKERMRQIEAQLMQQAYLSRRIEKEVTPELVKKRYDEFVKANPPQEEVRARHILLEDEAAAKAVIDDIQKGASFEDVAKEKSKGPSAETGGDLGFFTKDDMVPEFAQAAFAMKAGEVSKTPVKTQFGWHVIKVEERRMGQPPKLEELEEQLRGEASEEVVADILQNLRAKAQVKRFQIDGSPLAEAEPADGKPKAK